MSEELLKAMIEVFPNENMTVPYIELKFRYGGRFGMDVLEETLQKLIDMGYMTSYEFAGNVNYKNLKDLPISFSGGSTTTVTPAGDGSMASDIAGILNAMADKIGDSNITKMVSDFKNKYA
ncbi:MAG: hypothetical protein INQ03_19565 [Candidatus Heimdallarchaeota archaeon]|nr:hypothetical protein [Candidatus Heimdallarchaeota archaeon]